MSRALDWYGTEAFNEETLGEWEVEGKKAGKLRTWGPLSFASVYGAGHMVSGVALARLVVETKHLPWIGAAR